MEVVVHCAIGVDCAFLLELRILKGRFMFEATFEAFKVHIFELIVLKIKLFVVATPVEVNFSVCWPELSGAINSHRAIQGANCVLWLGGNKKGEASGTAGNRIKIGLRPYETETVPMKHNICL